MRIGIAVGIGFQTKKPTQPVYLVYDSFNRADASTLGTADTGQTWSHLLGTAGIASNKLVAKTNSGGNTLELIPAVAVDVLVSAQCTFVTTDGSMSLIVRGADASNLMRARIGATEIQLYRTVSGTSTVLGTYPNTWTSGATAKLSISVKGNTFKVYLNDVLIITVTDDNTTKTNTNVGVLMFKSGATAASTIDEFKAEAI